jgi:hypothetical protein
MVTGGGIPAYVGTSNSAWTGTNVDGIQFPNSDNATSCSAVLPIPNGDDLSVFGITTIHRTNPDPRYQRVFVRPVRSWTPHYVEDTDYLACAPTSRPFRDPPLHFQQMGSNMNYCAEVYPTQNGRLTDLEKSAQTAGVSMGQVLPYTSHVTKNSTSAACSARALTSVPGAIIPAGYPGGGAANHPGAPNTCDRTVITSGAAWGHFPLLAGAADTESALASDSSYACLVSWEDPSRVSKMGLASPSGGCCSAAVVNPASPNAHLEPGAAVSACAIPAY